MRSAFTADDLVLSRTQHTQEEPLHSSRQRVDVAHGERKTVGTQGRLAIESQAARTFSGGTTTIAEHRPHTARSARSKRIDVGPRPSSAHRVPNALKDARWGEREIPNNSESPGPRALAEGL